MFYQISSRKPRLGSLNVFAIIYIGLAIINFFLTPNPYSALHSGGVALHSQIYSEGFRIQSNLITIASIALAYAYTCRSKILIPAMPLPWVTAILISGLGTSIIFSRPHSYAYDSIALVFTAALARYDQRTIVYGGLKFLFRILSVIVVTSIMLAILRPNVWGYLPFEFSRESRGEATLAAMTGTLAAIPPLAFSLRSLSRAERFGNYLLVFIIVASTATRSTMMTVLLSLICFVAIRLRGFYKIIWMSSILSLLLYGFLAFKNVFILESTKGKSTLEATLTGRFDLWSYYLSSFYDAPILGNGAFLLERALSYDGVADSEIGLLKTAAEYGVIVAGIQLVTVIVACVAAVKALANICSSEIEVFTALLVLTITPNFILQDHARILNATDTFFWYAVFFQVFRVAPKLRLAFSFFVKRSNPALYLLILLAFQFRANEVVAAVESPYAEALSSVKGQGLPAGFDKSAWPYRMVAERLLSNLVGITGTSAPSKQSFYAAREVIGWLLDESYGKGIWWNDISIKSGDSNINRFVLLPLIDSIFRLQKSQGENTEIREWKVSLRKAVEFQIEAYQGKNWDGIGKVAGRYPNQDIYYALILALASRIFDEPGYQVLASQMIETLKGNILPNGAFHYIGLENESPIYHALIQCVLARYYEVTHDEEAWLLLKKSANYWLLVMSEGGIAESWSDVWWKQNWLNIPVGALTISAKVSGQPEIKWLEQKLLRFQTPREGIFDVYGSSWWDASLPAKAPPPEYLMEDPDIRGIRGRKDDWYFGLTEGRGLRNTFVGGMISSSTKLPALNAAFRGAQIEVKQPGDGSKHGYWLSQTSDRTVSLIAEGFGVLGAQYTLQRSSINGGFPPANTLDSPWQVTQIWMAGEKGIVGSITLTSKVDNDASVVIGRILLGPNSVEQIAPLVWRCGRLKIHLYRVFGNPTVRPSPGVYPSHVDSWPALEFAVTLKGMKVGDRFQYIVWIGPEHQSEPISIHNVEDGTALKISWKDGKQTGIRLDTNSMRLVAN